MLDSNKVKLAIAPIGWTNDDMPDLGAENTFEQCISEMLGFHHILHQSLMKKQLKLLKHIAISFISLVQR